MDRRMNVEEKIAKEKIEFIDKYGNYFEANILNKVNEKDNIMNLILAILISKNSLNDCQDYIILKEYIDKNKIIPLPIKQNKARNIISNIKGFLDKIYHHNPKGEKIQLRLTFYNDYLIPMDKQKQYRKQA